MGAIFISHSSRNNEQAILVRDWLKGEGWSAAQIFLDLDDLRSGDRWRQRLNEIGPNCEAVVVCLSDDWIASPECIREFTHAESAGKPIFPIVVAPIKSRIPEFVTAIQLVDVSDLERRAVGFEKLRNGLVGARIGPEFFPWPPASDPNRSSYRGLEALDEQDAAVFFGRDAQIARGLDVIRGTRDRPNQRLIAIVAASGAGKSSFLRAGLIPRLRRDPSSFHVFPTVRPRWDLLNNPDGLLKAIGLNSADVSDEQLAQHLSQAQLAARQDFASRTAAGEAERLPTLLIAIDQAEEMVTANQSHIGMEFLARCISANPDLLVVTTIRSDSLSMLQSHEALAAHLALFNLPSMPLGAFREVIEQPGLLQQPPISVDAALTERLLKDIQTEDALPILAFTLERLARSYGDDGKLELHEYELGLGGLAGAINAAAEDAYARAAADDQLPSEPHALDELVRSTFIPWLVRIDGGTAQPQRRIARLAELPEQSRPLVKHLVDQRLLISAVRDGELTIEVSHEALLRQWPRLKAWISEDRAFLTLLSEIMDASSQWRERVDADLGDLNWLIHRGERLAEAMQLAASTRYSRSLDEVATAYLHRCEEEDRKSQSGSRTAAFLAHLGHDVAEKIDLYEKEKARSSEGDQWGPKAVDAWDSIDKVKNEVGEKLDELTGVAKRWHPMQPITKYRRTHNDDFYEVHFPCCDKTMNLGSIPSQWRRDGCAPDGFVSIKLVEEHVPGFTYAVEGKKLIELGKVEDNVNSWDLADGRKVGGMTFVRRDGADDHGENKNVAPFSEVLFAAAKEQATQEKVFTRSVRKEKHRDRLSLSQFAVLVLFNLVGFGSVIAIVLLLALPQFQDLRDQLFGVLPWR